MTRASAYVCDSVTYNDPLNKTDPLGLRPLDDEFACHPSAAPPIFGSSRMSGV